MAASLNNNPWSFSAAADTDDLPHPFKIAKVQFKNGSGGAAAFQVLDASGGDVIAEDLSVAAGDVSEMDFPSPFWVDGIYINTIPATSLVYVYLDEEPLANI